MRVSAHGPERMMEDLRLMLQDQLEKAGYSEGPKVTSMDTGVLISYLKNDTIISIQVTEETETLESFLHVECEQDLLEFDDLWAAALIKYGRDVLDRLRGFARNKERVEQGIR